MNLSRIAALMGIVFLTSGFIGGWSSSEPEVWDIWEENNPQNTTPVDHSYWDGFLQKYLETDADGLNRFHYGRVTPEDKEGLKSYLDSLADIEITDRARPVQFAYWINLYNALTISVVLDHYPVKSIRDIDISGFIANGPWGKELITIEDADLTLDDIEHAILRPIWKDPRIHYGVNCASIGCPNLHTRAFTAANIDTLLDEMARNYINSPRGLEIRGDKVTVSKIFSWFAYDFGNSEAAIIDHIAKYAEPQKAEALKRIGSISDTQYDWSLNE